MPHPNPTTPSPAPRRATLASALALPALLLAGLPARADWSLLNMPVGVTPVSREVYDLHMLILWICTIIAVATFGAMAYALVAFRKSKGAVADTNMTHSTAAEIIWTVIPVVILVFMAFQAAPALIRIEDTRNSEMTIKITGYQWKWEYEYLNEGVSLFSSLAADSNAARRKNAGIDPRSVENYLLEVDEPLVVPAGVKIRYLITANDVLHAWWVPDFAVKRDAIPGYVNEGWFQVDEPGIYRGQCAELCGKDHGFMPVVVKVVPKAEFDAWLAARKAPAAVAAAN
ncbi:MAG: cytochrome c oxidase subunit II [Chromatiales bacterium]|jgi:cytochrome c oxidase subunit 2|nr:cytochrome c oxidase subunit II [Chromatiales bacterium]